MTSRSERASSWPSPRAVVFMAQPDNFSLYQPIVLGALWLGARGLKGSAGAFVAAGALVGLAMLARNDGVLVGAALGLLFLWDRFARLARRSSGGIAVVVGDCVARPVRPGDGTVVGAPAGGVRLDLPVVGVGSDPVDPITG